MKKQYFYGAQWKIGPAIWRTRHNLIHEDDVCADPGRHEASEDANKTKYVCTIYLFHNLYIFFTSRMVFRK